MNILVSGSTAYDYIMTFNDNFGNHIHPEKIHKLSVSFLIDDMKKELGGTGLNIAYNLGLLGDKPILISSIGKDFEFTDFHKEKINLKYINKSKELFSASGYITTDSGENQITAFYPGAMNEADKDLKDEIIEEILYGIVSPNKKEAMFKYLEYLKFNKIKSFFDPGQTLFLFSKDDLEKAINYADYLIVNDYEYNKFKEIINKKDEEILDLFERIIITYGGKGSKILSKSNGIINIPPVHNHTIKDPTGAGDSYRAGLLRGLQLGYNWSLSGKIGSLIASLSVGSNGGQNHFIETKDFEELFFKEFDEKIKLN